MQLHTLLEASAHAVADLFWPRICLICDREVHTHGVWHSLCGECVAGITHDPFVSCRQCASTVAAKSHLPTPTESRSEPEKTGCERCRTMRFHFVSAVRLCVYDGLRRDAVLRMKSLGGEALAETIAGLWARSRTDELKAGSPQLVVPVPLHWRRRWKRGYNQAEALARGLAYGLGLPLCRRWLRRVRATPPQTAMTVEGRRYNMAGAFAAKPHSIYAGMRVLLVDDVLTTGATVNEAAKTLLAAGAAQVCVAVFAHR